MSLEYTLFWLCIIILYSFYALNWRRTLHLLVVQYALLTTPGEVRLRAGVFHLWLSF